MDFDDLDDLEHAKGPSMEEVREECLNSAMPDPIDHPAPTGANFGSRGRLKMLFMGSIASNKKMFHLQANTIFNQVPNRDQYLDWCFFEGSHKAEASHHQNPEIAKIFEPYGPDFFTYFDPGIGKLNQQNEQWAYIEEEMELLAKYFKKNGPFDGIVGFDQGAALAILAASAAQEGHPDWQGMFRFLLIFSGHMPKELSSHAAKRPKSPLRIPTLLGWSEQDIAWSFTSYEDLALYIHPDFRQVVLHQQGHAAPLIEKNTEAMTCLEKFMDAMRYNLPFTPIMNAETATIKDLWLPLSRSPAAPSSPASELRLIVVTDPLGMHGPTSDDIKKDKNRPFDEVPKNAAKRVDLLRAVRAVTVSDFETVVGEILDGEDSGGRTVQVEGAEYLPEHREMPWHPAEHRVARWIDQEDEISLPWKLVEKVASEVLETIAIGEDDVFGIVGIGTGGHVAREMARQLIKDRSFMPAVLWLICPPTISPSTDAPPLGSLVNCSLRYLVPELAINGPPWRLELSTFGACSHSYFEEPAGAVRMVVEELLQAVPTSEE